MIEENYQIQPIDTPKDGPVLWWAKQMEQSHD